MFSLDFVYYILTKQYSHNPRLTQSIQLEEQVRKAAQRVIPNT